MSGLVVLECNEKQTHVTYTHAKHTPAALPRVVVSKNINTFCAGPLRCLFFPHGHGLLAAHKKSQR